MAGIWRKWRLKGIENAENRDRGKPAYRNKGKQNRNCKKQQMQIKKKGRGSIMKMRKKAIISLLTAAAVAAQCTTAFAARSTQSDDREPSYSSSSSQTSTVVTVTSSGVKTTAEVTSTNAGGSTIAIAVNTKTASGVDVKVNSKGEAIIGGKTVSFAKSEAAEAGLSSTTVNTINNINGGKTLSDIVVGYDLTERTTENGIVDFSTSNAPQMNLGGYNALTGTHALVTKNASTGKVEDTATETVIYVPNLIEGLGTVSVLYYDNVSGKWLLLRPTKIDTRSKLVYVTVPGSGTVSIVYKK